MKAAYSDQVNHLLRKYLKKGKHSEFERLVAYAELWGVENDQTRIMQALQMYRLPRQVSA